ncbi:MAG: septum formation initiator family protein [Actinobacteria bacterium]|nr:septum formation initiator family protein [Actinomycetota bacterium]
MTEPRVPDSRRSRALFLVVASLVAVGILFLLVYPLRAMSDQRDRLSEAEARLELLRDQNAKLFQRSQQLSADAEIERIARDRYNMVRPGEQAWAVVPEVSTPTTTTTTTVPPPASSLPAVP